jgi:transposase
MRHPDLPLASFASAVPRFICVVAKSTGTRSRVVSPSAARPNMTLVPLPPKCPELNPVENIWQFMQDNWLSNRVVPSYTNILDHCCDAWNKLISQPWTIMSVGLRDWAYGF